MSKQLTRIAGLKGLRDLIKQASEAHAAVSQFKTGLNILDDASENLYPLAFLESEFSSVTDGPGETFPVSLNIADRMPTDATEEAIIDFMMKTDQILSEIHYYLSRYASNVKVGEIRKMTFRDYDDDKLIVSRGEFDITIPRYTARTDSPVGL